MGATRSDWVELQRPASVSDVPPSDQRGPRVFIPPAILSYFIKSEAYTPHPKYPGVVASDHGSSGPWKTCHPDTVVRCFPISATQTNELFFQPITDILVGACDELGAKRIP